MSNEASSMCSLYDRRSQAAAVALVTERTIRDAARVARVSVATLVRWSKHPPFRQLVDETRREQRRQLLADAARRLQPA